jgi:hypothetical protein
MFSQMSIEKVTVVVSRETLLNWGHNLTLRAQRGEFLAYFPVEKDVKRTTKG